MNEVSRDGGFKSRKLLWALGVAVMMYAGATQASKWGIETYKTLIDGLKYITYALFIVNIGHKIVGLKVPAAPVDPHEASPEESPSVPPANPPK